MLTCNTFMTNVLYGEAVKVSLYAIPESTSCNCMLAIKKAQNFYAYWKLRLSPLLFSPLSSAEAPAGYPNNDSNNRKTESARRTMGRRKRRESLLPSSSFPSRPARFLFLSPRPHYDTKESLSKGVFERRTLTGSGAFSLLTCLNDIKFVFLSFFTVIKAIWLKIWAKPPFKNEKRPLPVSVRRSKTLLKLPKRPLRRRELSALLSWSLRCSMHVYLRLERLFRKYLSVRMLVDTALSSSGTYYKMKKKESESCQLRWPKSVLFVLTFKKALSVFVLMLKGKFRNNIFAGTRCCSNARTLTDGKEGVAKGF